MQASVAVIGATGAVGVLMRQVLEERGFPVEAIKFLASSRSVGQPVRFAGRDYTVEPITPEAFRGVRIALSSTPASVSREVSPVAAAAGAIVVDNSSAWRMDADVPLVVPEVNAAALDRIPKGIVANPNCSTIQMVVALHPLRQLGRIKRVIVSTYQASSGKGATGLADLDAQMGAVGRGEPVPAPTAHAAQLAMNAVSHDWKAGADGYTEEEWKMVYETRKIMGEEGILVSPTCVRVPVRVGHSEAVNVEFDRAVSPGDAMAALRGAAGVIVQDDPPPTPLTAAGRDEVFVGRVRRDPSNPNALNLWVVADNLRKGAATNAVQIAELLLAKM